MEIQKSYIFRAKDVRPTKRRRITTPDAFSATLGMRKREYERQWTKAQECINDILKSANTSVIKNLEEFLTARESSEDVFTRLPIGLLSTTYGSVSSKTLFEQLFEDRLNGRMGFASLEGAECTNLKMLLKTVIQKATNSRTTGDDDDIDQSIGEFKSAKLLDYDLRLVQRWCRLQKIYHIVIAFPDGETLDPDLFAHLVSHLHSWRDRIRFIILLGVSSSEIFSERLSRSTQKLLFARLFAVESPEVTLEKFFEGVALKSSTAIRLGPSIAEMLLARQREHVVGIETLTQSLKYAYMSHFIGNPMSVLLVEDLEVEDLSESYFEVIRCLPSFRTKVEVLLQEKKSGIVKKLLDSDHDLFEYVRREICLVNDNLQWSLSSLVAIIAIQKEVGLQPSSFANLYVQGLSSKESISSTIRELAIRMKVSPAKVIIRILNILRDTTISLPASDLQISPDTFGDLADQLTKIRRKLGNDCDETQETHRAKPSDTKTTLARQRTNSSKHPQNHSPIEVEQAKVLQECYENIEGYFKQVLQPAKALFMNEAIFYDLKVPHRDAFTPKIRFGIERALSAPQDYLGCSCCTNAKDNILPTQPPTSILYQLYLESGSLINIFDLWVAFEAIVANHYNDDQLIKALFFKSLAELKTMGFIKPSRKRIDHVAKLAWKGL